MLVELHYAARHAAVVLKMGVPVSVGENDVRSAVGATLIGGVKETAEVGLDVQCVEIISCDFEDPGGGWIVAGIDAYRCDIVGCQVFKSAVAIAQVEVVGIGMIDGFVVAALDGVETFRLGHINRTQYQGVHYAEDD